jgi:excinuclease ABC subunit A
MVELNLLDQKKSSWGFKQMEAIAQRYKFSLNDPIDKIPKVAMDIILRGGSESFSVQSKSLGVTRRYSIDYEGIENFIQNQYYQSESTNLKRWAADFMDEEICSSCQGSRLNHQALNFKINGDSIADLANMDLNDLYQWILEVPKTLTKNELKIGEEVIKEVKTRTY